MAHPVRSLFHALRAAWRWLARWRKQLPLLLMTVVLVSHGVQAEVVQVNAASAHTLSIRSLADYASLTGRDPSEVIALYLPGIDSVSSLSRSDATFTWSLDEGDWAARGGPLGGTRLARVYDGSLDQDQLSPGDSVTFRDDIMFELLFRPRPNPAYTHRYVLWCGSGDDRISLFGTNQLKVYLAGVSQATVTVTNNRWTLLRVLIDSDSVGVALNGGEMSYLTHVASLSAATPVHIGAPEFYGEIALLAVLARPGHAAGVEHDGLWNALRPFLDGSQPFASPQTALDQGANDTVAVASGVYPAPLVVETAVTLVGSTHKTGTILNGAAWPSATSAVTALDVPVTLSNLVIRSAPVAVTARSGTSTDTLRVLNCTLVGNGDGLVTESGDGRPAITRNNLLVDHAGIALSHKGSGSMLNRYNLFHNNLTDYVNTIGDLYLINADPLLKHPDGLDVRPLPGSPAAGRAADGGVLGALPVLHGWPGRWGQPAWSSDRWQAGSWQQ